LWVMPMSKVLHAIRVAAVPLLFAAASLGLAAVHISLERKAEHSKARTPLAAAVQDSEKLAGLKLQDLAPAAQKGDIQAEVEMARRLALGEGVKKNEAEAALYFQAVINQLGEIGARDKRGPFAATAFRFLAQYNRRGLPEANIARNPAYAFDLLHHAASYFGDPIAQYELARLLIDGDGVTRNSRVGAQWLLRAARKGYAPAQALLGDMLWHGNGVKREPGEGLGLLAIARRNASPADKAWVSKMFEAARAEALPIEILEANAFIVQESGASPFGASSGLIDAGAQEGMEAAAKPSVNPDAGANSLLRGADPFYGLDPSDRSTSAEKTDSKSAGIFQMYRPSLLEPVGDNGAPMRVAGVTK
jgi:uncharacterized protein